MNVTTTSAPRSRSARVGQAAAPLLLVGGLAVLWVLADRTSDLVASPVAAATEAWRGLRDGWLRTALASTVGSVAVGFGLAFVVGLLIATLLAASRFARDVAQPLLSAYGSIPRVVFFPALLSIFGVGATSKQAMGFLSAVYPVIVTVTAGVVSTPPLLGKLGSVMRLGPVQRFRLITVPAALPSIVLAARLGFSIALISVVVSEYFGARDGLGVILSDSYALLDTDRMYAVVLTIAVLATVVNVGLWRIQQRLEG